MAMIQTKFYKNPFAVHGDKAQLPETAQPDGKLNYETGYTLNYELDPETNPSGLDIERLQFNQVLYDLTLNMYQYQIYGTPNFITSEMNGGTPFPYPKWAYALYDDGVNGMHIYRSKIDNNTSLPTDATKWLWVTDPNLTDVKYGASADLSANVPLPHGVIVPIVFNNIYDNSGNIYRTGKLIIPFKGSYNVAIGGQIYDAAGIIPSDNTIRLVMGGRLAGNTIISSDSTTFKYGTGPWTAESSTSRDLILNAGDEIEFFAVQTNSASSGPVDLHAGVETYMSCHLNYRIDE